MSFGDDGRGNRGRRDDSDEEGSGVSSGDDVPHNGRHDDDVNNDAAASESDFSDDVELVIGEAATQSIHQPLVDATQVEPHTGRTDTTSFFLLTHDTTATASTAATPLLLESRPDTDIDAEDAALRFAQLLGTMPQRVHCVTVIGDLHHGKTSLLRMLLRGQCYQPLTGEAARAMTLKSHVVTVAAGGAALQPTSRLLTFIDTPGHPDFVVETAAALRLADVALLCVDVVESLSASAAQLVRQCVLCEEVPVVLVLTKVDRLLIDLKLPPLDAYRRLRSVVETVNNVIASCGTVGASLLVAPENGTVAFASSTLGFCFSLETFAAKYGALHRDLDHALLAQRLWGQLTFDHGRFVPITRFQQRPSFVAFVLEPLYKIVAHSVTGKGATTLSSALPAQPRSPLAAMQAAVRLFCGDPGGEGLDVLLSVLPAAQHRLRWLGARYGVAADAPTSVLAIATLAHLGTAAAVMTAVRVVRGTLREGARVRILGPTSSDAEPVSVVHLTRLFLPLVGLSTMATVTEAHEGQVVYVTGIGAGAGHHLVLVGCDDNDDEEGDVEWLDRVQLPSLGAGAQALVHVGVELKEPAKLAQLQDGLQTLVTTTPGLDVHREETGEFTLSGFGEVQLDAALHELRRGLCAGLAVDLSQPYVTFQETVLDTDGVLAVGGGRRAGVGCTSGVLPAELVAAIEYGTIDLAPTTEADAVRLWTVLRRDYAVDALDARHILAVGPDHTRGPSVLFDDTLEEEMRDGTGWSTAQRAAVVAGFRAVVAAGPLIAETVRGVGVRVIFADLAPDTRQAQVMASARTAVRHALLGARPRLLEPVWEVEVLCTAEGVAAVRAAVQQRRGSVIGEEPVMATPLLRLRALVPAMDGFGLETQLRATTHGEAYPTLRFAHWDIVPGDPFDATIRVAPLEPAKGYQLARDFVLKTRFRRGLPLNLMAEL